MGKWSKENVELICTLREEGKTAKEIAEELNKKCEGTPGYKKRTAASRGS